MPDVPADLTDGRSRRRVRALESAARRCHLDGMKSLFRPLAGLALAATAVVTAAGFEGKVSLGFKSGREAEQLIDYAMKDGVIRMEPKMAEAAGTAMILHLAKQEMTVLMPEQSMYLVMPLKGAKNPAAAKAEVAEAKVEKTGETDVILGYLCEKYLMVENGVTTEMWITEELGPFGGLGGNPMAGMMGGGGPGAKAGGGQGWEQALKGRQGAFPLRVVSRDAKGRETFRLETRKIEPGTLPDSLFKAPAGYQKMNLPMMGGFGG